MCFHLSNGKGTPVKVSRVAEKGLVRLPGTIHAVLTDMGLYLIQGLYPVKGTWGLNAQLPIRQCRLSGGGHKGNSHRPPLRDRAGNEGGELLRSLLCQGPLTP